MFKITQGVYKGNSIEESDEEALLRDHDQLQSTFALIKVRDDLAERLKRKTGQGLAAGSGSISVDGFVGGVPVPPMAYRPFGFVIGQGVGSKMPLPTGSRPPWPKRRSDMRDDDSVDPVAPPPSAAPSVIPCKRSSAGSPVASSRTSESGLTRPSPCPEPVRSFPAPGSRPPAPGPLRPPTPRLPLNCASAATPSAPSSLTIPKIAKTVDSSMAPPPSKIARTSVSEGRSSTRDAQDDWRAPGSSSTATSTSGLDLLSEDEPATALKLATDHFNDQIRYLNDKVANAHKQMDATVGIARRYKAETAALVDENAALRTENRALKEEVAELRKKAMLEAEK